MSQANEYARAATKEPGDGDLGSEEDGLHTPLNPSSSGKKKPYGPVIIAYIFYTIVYTIVVPALPALSLRLSNDDSARSSYLYGMANFARYISEFFAAPILGTSCDIVGRKPMLFLSFLACATEYALLAFFPSIPMLFVTRVMAGLFDSSNPTVYTILTDIALYNGDNVTAKFGLVTALLGVGFVVGPLVGGILIGYSISLCFFISTLVSVFGGIVALVFLEETLPLVSSSRAERTISVIVGTTGPSVDLLLPEETDRVRDDSDERLEESKRPEEVDLLRRTTHISAITTSSSGDKHAPKPSFPFPHRTVKSWRDVTVSDLNPIPALILHFKQRAMRHLTLPLLLSSLPVGCGSIWYIYMDYAYDASSTDIGIYLAFYGIVSAIVLGYLIKKLIPGILSEAQAAVYGCYMLAVQFLGYGLSPTYWGLFVVAVLCTVGTISDPALKGLMVQLSLDLPEGRTLQGNLQGVLCSVRTLATAFGSLFFAAVFAESIKLHPPVQALSFACGALMYLGAGAYLHVLLRCYAVPVLGERYRDIFYVSRTKMLEESSAERVDMEQEDGSPMHLSQHSLPGIVIPDLPHSQASKDDSASLSSGQHFRTSGSGWKAWLSPSSAANSTNSSRAVSREPSITGANISGSAAGGGMWLSSSIQQQQQQQKQKAIYGEADASG